MTAIKSLIVAALLAAGVQSASAQLYTRDSEFGVDTVVVDTRTDLSWLQLSQSTALNFADFDFPAEYVPGVDTYDWTVVRGAYAGYRVANVSEIRSLVDDYVRCPDGPSSCGAFRWGDQILTDMGLANRALDLIALFGGRHHPNARQATTTAASGLRRAAPSLS